MAGQKLNTLPKVRPGALLVRSASTLLENLLGVSRSVESGHKFFSGVYTIMLFTRTSHFVVYFFCVFVILV